MNVTSGRAKFIKSIALISCLAGGCAAPNVYMGESDRSRYDDAKTLKLSLEWVAKAWVLHVEGVNYYVYHQVFPTLGQSREWVTAWRENKGGVLLMAWSYRSSGVGPIKVDVDETSGIVKVTAIANTKHKGSVIAMAHLAAT